MARVVLAVARQARPARQTAEQDRMAAAVAAVSVRTHIPAQTVPVARVALVRIWLVARLVLAAVAARRVAVTRRTRTLPVAAVVNTAAAAARVATRQPLTPRT